MDRLRIKRIVVNKNEEESIKTERKMMMMMMMMMMKVKKLQRILRSLNSVWIPTKAPTGLRSIYTPRLAIFSSLRWDPTGKVARVVGGAKISLRERGLKGVEVLMAKEDWPQPGPGPFGPKYPLSFHRNNVTRVELIIRFSKNLFYLLFTFPFFCSAFEWNFF